MATPESGVGAGRFVFTFFLSAATVLGLSTCVMDWTSPDECGNGVIDDGEECDGTNLDGETCISQGYFDGALNCAGDCTFDFESCEPIGVCGDNEVNSADEECDGADFGGQTCQSRGYTGGSLTCKAPGDINPCTIDEVNCLY